MIMRIRCIACEVLARPVYLAAGHSPHAVDVTLLPRGLHTRPEDLRARLQAEVDASAGYDAVALVYGLCGGATAGLTARDARLILPRAHDCITLFLGARARYQREFEREPGTYWYVRDDFERRRPGEAATFAGAASEMDMDAAYADFIARYGQDNADYLMEVMGVWREHYRRAVYIEMENDGGALQNDARAEAARRGWTFEVLAGDMVLVRRLLAGDWDDDFLIVWPGQSVTPSYDENIIRCAIDDKKD